MKKYIGRSSNQVFLGNATVWLNYQKTKAAMKKEMMVLPAKFAGSPG